MSVSIEKPATNRALGPISPLMRNLALALLVIAIGTLLGRAMLKPAGEIVTSVIGISIYMAVILVNPLHGLLLWIVTQPLADAYLFVPLGAGIPDLTPTRFCILFTTVLVLARVATRRQKLVPLTKIDLVAFAYLLGMSFAAPSGTRGWATLQDVFEHHAVPVLVYLLAKNLVTDQRQLKKVVAAMMFMGTYLALYATYEQLTGHILLPIGNYTWTTYGSSGLRFLRGIMGSAHPFGRVFGIVIPVNFYLALEERRPTRRVFYYLTLSAMFLGLYLTYRRTAWIAALASLFLIQWFYPRFRNLFLALLVVAALGLYLNREQLGGTSVARRVQTGFEEGQTSTLHGRTDAWDFALRLWRQRPLTGYGLGQYGKVAERYKFHDVAIESQYIGILFSAGLLGFVPYVALLIMIPLSLVKTLWSDSQPVNRGLIVMYWGAHLSYLINASTSSVAMFVTTSLLFLFAGALSSLQARSSGMNVGPSSVRVRPPQQAGQ